MNNSDTNLTTDQAMYMYMTTVSSKQAPKQGTPRTKRLTKNLVGGGGGERLVHGGFRRGISPTVLKRGGGGVFSPGILSVGRGCTFPACSLSWRAM